MEMAVPLGGVGGIATGVPFSCRGVPDSDGALEVDIESARRC